MKVENIKSRRYLIAGALAAFLILVLIYRGCAGSESVSYEYERVSRGEVKKTVVLTGDLHARGVRTVRSDIAGTVNSVHVAADEDVKKGQLLVEIDTSDIDHNLEKLKYSLENSRLRLQVAESDLRNKTTMFEEKLISESAYNQAEVAYKTAYNDFQRIQKDYNQQLSLRQGSRIRSPIDGFVLSREVQPDQRIRSGDSMFTIVPSLETMTLILDVDESDVGQVRRGQQVTFTVSAYHNKTFTGEISSIRTEPVTRGNIVTYHSHVRVDNKELLLKPGMTATATVLIDKKDDVLRVSNLALVAAPVGHERGNTDVLWIRRGTGFEVINIKSGLSGDSHAEILDGVREGTEVLLRARR